jgi:alpha-tubulin suppressor-like RCC1 family protein
VNDAWIVDVSIIRHDIVCALLSDGGARCRRFPGDATPVLTLAGVRAVTASFVVRTDGSVERWIPSRWEDPKETERVSSLSGVVAITGSDDDGGCALLRDGQVRCWGRILTGGAKEGSPTIEAPSKVAIPAAASKLVGDARVACALTAIGRVYCWGDNSFAECGTPKYRLSGDMDLIAPAPVEVANVHDALDVAAGMTSCARLADGGVTCWGSALGSRLNDKAASDFLLSLPRTGADARAIASRPPGFFYQSVYHPPERLPGVAAVAQIAADRWLWTRFADGTLGYHRLGRTRPKLERFAGVTGAVALSVGTYFACAVTAARDVFCWRYGTSYNWGPGSDEKDDPGPPVRVEFLPPRSSDS